MRPFKIQQITKQTMINYRYTIRSNILPVNSVENLDNIPTNQVLYSCTRTVLYDQIKQTQSVPFYKCY